MTKVIFRKIKATGRIIAIFPFYYKTMHEFLSYENGKFGSVNQSECFKNTLPTVDYFDLLNELLINGYTKIKIVECSTNF